MPVAESENTVKINRLTSGRLLARNAVWNLVGSGIPMLVAVVCIPILIRGLGTDRFGVLTLAWALIGYASLFDLGIGRALTKLVAERFENSDLEETYRLIWTSLFMMLILGMTCTGVAVMISPWLVHRELNIPPTLQAETLSAFYALGIGMPIVITSSGLRGVLEARQRFDLINWLRIPLGIFLLAGPLAVLPFSKSLVPVVWVLVGARTVSWAGNLFLCFHIIPGLKSHIRLERHAMQALLSFGGWMTVTNIVGPLMVTFDRFVIGSVASVAAVAYYATPFEMVTKFWVVPSALLGVMFPAFSSSFIDNSEHTGLLFRRSIKFVFVFLFPVVVLTIAFAKDGLAIWLGMNFANHSSRVLQWLAVGVFLNGLAQVPCVLVQGVGRPDWAAKAHLVEVPCYLGLLWAMIRAHGVEGAAMAWTIRIAIDALIMFMFALRLLPECRTAFRRAIAPLGFALLALALATLPASVAAEGSFSLHTLIVYGFIAWYFGFTPMEKTALLRSLKPVRIADH